LTAPNGLEHLLRDRNVRRACPKLAHVAFVRGAPRAMPGKWIYDVTAPLWLTVGPATWAAWLETARTALAITAASPALAAEVPGAIYLPDVLPEAIFDHTASLRQPPAIAWVAAPSVRDSVRCAEARAAVDSRADSTVSVNGHLDDHSVWSLARASAAVCPVGDADWHRYRGPRYAVLCAAMGLPAVLDGRVSAYREAANEAPFSIVTDEWDWSAGLDFALDAGSWGERSEALKSWAWSHHRADLCAARWAEAIEPLM
jgi:hypothetical protein